MRPWDRLRKRVAAAATSPFGHAPYPLARSLSYRGDPGLFGPGSASWRVIGDVSSFIGGVRALLIQAAHPEVVAGVADHSRYREDPLGRLSRTSAYITATTFGAMPEVEAAVEAVQAVHRPVQGVSLRDRPYSASDPGMAAWVHNALTGSFLTAYQRYGPKPLPEDKADRFVAEQTRLGELLGADPLPPTARELDSWLAEHPDAGSSPAMRAAVAFLRRPPGLSRGQRLGYRLLLGAAVATIPSRLRRILGVRSRPGSILAGRAIAGILRWALGSSPSWKLALVRIGAPVPPGLFSQPLPGEDAGATGRPSE